MIEARVKEYFYHTLRYDDDIEVEFKTGDIVYIVAVVDNEHCNSGKAFVCVFPIPKDVNYEGWEATTIDSRLVETIGSVEDLLKKETIPYFEN